MRAGELVMFNLYIQRNIRYLAILCGLFWMFKCSFKGSCDLQLGNQKVILNHRISLNCRSFFFFSRNMRAQRFCSRWDETRWSVRNFEPCQGLFGVIVLHTTKATMATWAPKVETNIFQRKRWKLKPIAGLKKWERSPIQQLIQFVMASFRHGYFQGQYLPKSNLYLAMVVFFRDHYIPLIKIIPT